MESIKDRTRFAQFVSWLTPITIFFGVAEFLSALVYRKPALAAAGLVTLLYGACLLIARRFLKRGNLKAAVKPIGLFWAIFNEPPPGSLGSKTN